MAEALAKSERMGTPYKAPKKKKKGALIIDEVIDACAHAPKRRASDRSWTIVSAM